MVSLEFDIATSPLLLKLLSSRLPPGENVLSLVYTSVALLLAYAFGLAVYRLNFHPLSKYPGPRLAAVTNLYRHSFAVRGRDQFNNLRLHNEYGPVVRNGPNSLVYIDSDAWKGIYGHRTGGKKSNRRQNGIIRYPGHGSLITIASDEKHGQRRRIFAHAFSDKALREQEPMFQKYVDMLVRNLGRLVARDPESKVNLVDHLNYTTFDVMGDLSFSEPLGMLEKSEYSPWVKAIFSAIKTSTFLLIFKDYGPIRHLLAHLVPAKLRAQREAHFKFSEERVDRRMENGSDKPDIWSLIVKQAGEKAVPRKEMYSNADFFMIAGTETTATLLSGMSYFLMKTPHAMKRLQAELDAAFPGGRGVTSEKLAQLKYLQACIEEGLRIYPPAPLATMRITPPEGTVIADKYVPGETLVGITHYAAYHSERNFALPEEYHPERWLASGEEGADDPRFAHDNKAAHNPFSVGPRNCLGKNMAWYEMRLIAAQLLLNFDLELQPEAADWHDQKIFSLWQKKPLIVKLRPRQAVQA